MTARYYLYKLQLADDFRASPPLYSTEFHWAVKKGRTELLAFIQQGFDKFAPNELEDINNKWVGNPIRFPIATRFWYYLATVAVIALVLYLVLVVWNRMLRKRVAAKTAELDSALGSLRQAVGAGNVGLFDWDLKTDRIHYSPEWKRQIGHDDDEISDTYSEWHDRIHPDDRERVLAVVRECIDARPHECRRPIPLSSQGRQLPVDPRASGRATRCARQGVENCGLARRHHRSEAQRSAGGRPGAGARAHGYGCSARAVARHAAARRRGPIGGHARFDPGARCRRHPRAPSCGAQPAGRILSRHRRRIDRRRRRVVRDRHASRRTCDRRGYRKRSVVGRLSRNCAAPRIAGGVVDADLRRGQEGPGLLRAVFHRTAPPVRISSGPDCDGDPLRSHRDHQAPGTARADRGRRAACDLPSSAHAWGPGISTCPLAGSYARMRVSRFAGLRRERRSRRSGSSKCCTPRTAKLPTPRCAVH